MASYEEKKPTRAKIIRYFHMEIWNSNKCGNFTKLNFFLDV